MALTILYYSKLIVIILHYIADAKDECAIVTSTRRNNAAKTGDLEMNIDTATKQELETEIVVGEDSLYKMFDEQKLLSGEYTVEELRTTIKKWIESCPEA